MVHHLEIKFLFNDFLDKLKNALLNSSTVPQNLFINIFVDSDDDETTGFLGYNYRYLLTHNNANFYNNNTLNSLLQTFLKILHKIIQIIVRFWKVMNYRK